MKMDAAQSAVIFIIIIVASTIDSNSKGCCRASQDNNSTIDDNNNTNSNNYSTCGASYAGSKFRIVGGQAATGCQFPWVVMVIQMGSWRNRTCDGSILDERHILTAAHCLFSSSSVKVPASPGTLVVHSGSINRHSGYDERRVEKVTVHPNYDSYHKHNDLAILRLKDELKFDRCQSPICLHNDTTITAGRSCRIMGWGRDSYYSANKPAILQWVEDPMLDSDSCKQLYGRSWDQGRVCGKNPAFCAGDSGGPYVCQESDGRWSQYGIVSGYPGGTIPCTTPGIYTMVPYYKDWIDEQTNNATVTQ